MLQRFWNLFDGGSAPGDDHPSGAPAPATAAAIAADAAWYDRLVNSARTHGRMPYVVEGFHEVWDAVRRGHAVVLVREPAQVADDCEVFAEAAGSAQSAPGLRNEFDSPPLVTVRTFSMSRARFEIHDPHSPSGELQLTPKRLQRYLDAPSRAVGVAIGA